MDDTKAVMDDATDALNHLAGVLAQAPLYGLITVTEQLAAAIGGLNALDTHRGEDIDELREEVASLGAKFDAMQRALEASDSWVIDIPPP